MQQRLLLVLLSRCNEACSACGRLFQLCGPLRAVTWNRDCSIVISRPAEKPAIFVVHCAILPNLTSPTYPFHGNKGKWTGKESHLQGAEEQRQSKRTASLDDPAGGPFWYRSVHTRVAAWFLGPLTNDPRDRTTSITSRWKKLENLTWSTSFADWSISITLGIRRLWPTIIVKRH